MGTYLEFLAGFSCMVWIALTFLTCGVLSLVTSLAKDQMDWRKVFVISAMAFCFGALSILRDNPENTNILQFVQSRDFTILVLLSALTTVILADLLGLIKKKGDGWKIGAIGLIALHFGCLAVFYPIF